MILTFLIKEGSVVQIPKNRRPARASYDIKSFSKQLNDWWIITGLTSLFRDCYEEVCVLGFVVMKPRKTGHAQCQNVFLCCPVKGNPHKLIEIKQVC